MFLHDRVLMDRLRSIAFALLTPFFFLRAGTLISAPALVSGAGVIAVLLLVKLAAKMIGVWPTAAAFKLPRRERTYTTLLMATGLTFGSIAALFGLTHGPHRPSPVHRAGDRRHPVRFVPTLIAQQLFRPAVLDAEEEEALGEEDLSIVHHRPHPPGGPTRAARPGAARPGAVRLGAAGAGPHIIALCAGDQPGAGGGRAVRACPRRVHVPPGTSGHGQARVDGDADLAGAIKKLRRPTVSAWLVNLLVREAPRSDTMNCWSSAESLREAQQALAADRLRDLSAQRRQLVAALTQEAKATGGGRESVGQRPGRTRGTGHPRGGARRFRAWLTRSVPAA